LSFQRRRESSDVKSFWIPAFAGMTFLEVALKLTCMSKEERNLGVPVNCHRCGGVMAYEKF
jgi:hypothetical protein